MLVFLHCTSVLVVILHSLTFWETLPKVSDCLTQLCMFSIWLGNYAQRDIVPFCIWSVRYSWLSGKRICMGYWYLLVTDMNMWSRCCHNWHILGWLSQLQLVLANHQRVILLVTTAVGSITYPTISITWPVGENLSPTFEAPYTRNGTSRLPERYQIRAMSCSDLFLVQRAISDSSGWSATAG